MKKISFAFLLSILCSTLVGCGGNNPDPGPEPEPTGNQHTITFNGENCFIRDESGSEFTTKQVEDGTKLDLEVFVKDTENYLLPGPGDVKATEGVKCYYYSRTGKVNIPSVVCDITITAKARTRSHTVYTIEYPDDPNADWDGPTEVNSGDQLDANIDITTESYFITENDIFVKIGNNYYFDFTFVDNKLTIPAGAIDGNVVIYGLARRPSATYNVELNVSNATKGDKFPTVAVEGNELTATFTANKGYRLPRIIDGDPKSDEFTIHKRGSGVNMTLTPYNPKTYTGDFTYRISEKDGVEYAEVYILPGVLINSNFDTVSFEGAAVEQVTVTFTVGEGHWQNPLKTDEDRYGTIDKGDTLENALKDASGGETPIIDTAGWEFGGWLDESEGEVHSGDVINQTMTVHATYKQIDYTIYDEIDDNINVSPELPNSVHYHGAISEITLTTTDGYKLPARSEVKVSMRHIDKETDEWLPLDDFNYSKSTDTTATFSINSGIITGDIKINIVPIQYYTITFDPNGGEWPLGGSRAKTTSVPVGSTYQEAFDSLKTGGDPTKGTQRLSAWMCEGTAIKMEKEILADEMVLTAEYSEFVTFQNDTWANVIKHAEAGDLKITYKDTIALGAERPLVYTDPITNEQKTYKVRIIDSGYDRYMKDGKRLTSALTFEFVDLVGEGDYGDPYPPAPSNGKNSWWDSVYRRYLDTFYKEICKQNEGFEAKSAIKYTLHGYVAPEEAPLDPRTKFETTEYFFPLSGAEIGLADSSSGANPTYYTSQQRKNEALREGDTVWAYEYYKDNTHSRVKNLYNAEPETGIKYWLRSPHVYTPGSSDPNETNCYFIKETGGTDKDYGGFGATADYDYGYMAAFCI